jgi:ferredoxin-nitrite reductase
MWLPVARAAELRPESAQVVRAGDLTLALVCTADGLHAIDNVCPHSGGSLGEGVVEGNVVICPLHSYRFDCRSGTCLTEKRPPQRRYPVKVEGDKVLVELPEAGAAPAEPTWVAVADVAALRPGGAMKVEAGGATIALVCTAQGFHALENACPHQGASLSEGSVDGPVITCPLHGWQFDCADGRCLGDEKVRARTFETKVEGDRVWVRVAAASVSAAPVSAAPAADPATLKSPVEIWKSAKHGIDAWPDILRYAREGTPMDQIEVPDLERMKWYGYFYRKNNDNDHYMCRIRIPGCEMTAEQARAIAFVAYESGYSMVDVTTRGNIQVQGLTIEKLPGVRAVLERVGLTSRQSGHDNVRNIMSHPLSGIDPQELIDTRELSRKIQDLIIGSREFSDLPRKFNVALCGRADPAPNAWAQDLCFAAALGPDGTPGFHLLVGGNQGQSPALARCLPVFVRVEQVVETTAAVLRTFRELGYRHNRHEVRFRFLLDRLGPERVLEEIERRLGSRLERFERVPKRPSREEDFVGWFAQKQPGLWAVGVCIPVGRLPWDKFDGLADVARRYGGGTLRTTHDQNLLIPDVPEHRRGAAACAIARLGLGFEADSVVRNLVACTGKQFCNLAVTETKGYAYQLIEELRRRYVQLHGIKIHLSGCPSSCANSYVADIGLKGVKIRPDQRVLDAFDVFLAGGVGGELQLGTLYRKGVRVDHLPELIQRLVGDYYAGRADGETFSRYWRRKLEGHVAEKKREEIPRWRCAGCGYDHVSPDPPVYCPVCSALRAKFEPAAEETAAAPMEPWVCGSCNFKREGERPPELCPVCGEPAAAFKRGEARRAAAVERPAGRRIVIVGGSIGGHTAAQTARALDPAARITLVTDEKISFYNRLNLTRLLSQEVRRDELFDYGPEWYQERRVQVLTETRAIGIDPVKRVVLLAEGRELSYDACILAHGSAAAVPPFYRAGLEGVTLLRTLEDVDRIVAASRPGAQAAVIGGGVLGLEAAYGMVKRGARVRVFEYLPRLMPRQLDEAGAALFLDLVLEKGIEPYVGVGVREILGRERAEGIALADGRRFEADLVVVSTGIRPNVDWVKRSGIHCEHGVVVDDRMQTSAPNVYAAGDVVQWQGRVVGLWTNAIEQAKVAATNAAGKTAFFQGFLPVTILKCLGVSLVSMGEVPEDGGGITSARGHDVAERTYQRVIFRDGIPVGAILLGTSRRMGELRKLIERGSEVERLKRALAPEPQGAATGAS